MSSPTAIPHTRAEGGGRWEIVEESTTNFPPGSGDLSFYVHSPMYNLLSFLSIASRVNVSSILSNTRTPSENSSIDHVHVTLQCR